MILFRTAMETLTYNFELLTDTFSHGAYQTQNFNRPELRAPSVKGMIRWWHKALGFSDTNAGLIFGQAGRENYAARVAVRVRPLAIATKPNAAFMPHKGAKGGQKTAINPGSSYELKIVPRLNGLDSTHESELKKSIEAWLLLGSIGQRANRVAGSIQWEKSPATRKDFELTASQLTAGTPIRFAFLDEDLNNDQIRARHIAGDFLKSDAFGSRAPFGSAYPRKPSPLKLKCVKVDGALNLLAIWDSRGETFSSLESGVATLIQANKPIGRLLLPALASLK